MIMENLKLDKITHIISLDEYRRGYQDVEKFLGYCEKCRNFGKQWVCPPFDFDINEVLNQFQTIELIGYKLNIPQDLINKEMSMWDKRAIADQYLTQFRIITDPELWEMEAQHPGSRAFYAGSCHLCDPLTCTRTSDPQTPCRHPSRARNSLENFGFDLKRTAEELLGTPMLWITDDKLPPYYFFIAALMY